MNRDRLKNILREIRHKDKRIDDHAQPINRDLSASRLARRAVDEIIGISKGITSDGIINQDEAEFIVKWLSANEHAIDVFPINLLYDRLNDVLADDVLDQEEATELLDMLQQFTGGGSMEKYENMSTALPLDDPAPAIIFEGREFCFTGKFVFGTRNQCIEAVKMKGGFFNPSPRQNTDYLIVGLVGSRDWLHTTHGKKIEEAIDMQASGKSIAIVSERHWVNYL